MDAELLRRLREADRVHGDLDRPGDSAAVTVTSLL
jgi:hypothetical protein